MAQKSNQRQPVYSADTLALRYIAGLALVALGVMMFLAVELRLAGNVFDALRQVCFGLTGGLAVLLPALPIWAGVLVIWSSQRKAPVKPFLYGVLAYLGLCAFIVLVTKIGTEEYLAMLSRASDGSWGGVISQGYIQSIQWRASGGALGIILAYPFWSLVGTILGAAVLFLATLFCILMAVNLTPKRIQALVTGQEVFHFGRRRENQAAQDQRQIAFQQEQERQRQIAYAQQQAYILQQQQQQQAQAAARQNSAAWNRNQPQAEWPNSAAGQGWPEQSSGAGSGRGWTNVNPAMQDSSVAEWQQQLTEQRASLKSGRKSSIFGTKQEAAEPRRIGNLFGSMDGGQEQQPGYQPAAAQEKNPPFSSRIFGRKKDQGDGLSDLSAAQKREEGMAYPASSRLKTQTTSRTRMAQEQVEADLDRWRRPAEAQGEISGIPENTQANQAPARDQQIYSEPDDALNGAARSGAGSTPAETPWEAPARNQRAAGENGDSLDRQSRNGISCGAEALWETPAQPAGRESSRQSASAEKSAKPAARSKWMDQVLAAEKAGQRAGNGAMEDPAEDAPAPRPDSMEREPQRESRKPEQITIPVVQETIANPTWKPELKHVEPKEPEPEDEYWEPTPYYAPPITDLKKPDASVLDTTQEDEARSRRLEATLASFNVQARVMHVTHGPAISRFEMELAPGTKVNKVAGLEKDIAYGMEATSVRIEAPIPGKSLVGVEVPNPKRATVTLREVLESPQMQNAKSILTVALGKDIAGTPVVCDLAKMPHMLIAGATGSGKSVCINTIINSLLYRAGPDEVKMILVDPKVVELQCYNGIPHLLLPVVNDPHKASAALAWAVAEMMERYDKFAERGVRNLEGYNNILGPGEKPMPRIVIIIDELADLMMVCKKDVEEYICRITQLARAAGIHLIVATQRPSVDVITGLIKANIPSRIAFKTASSVDSRTILDRNGSEQLLGLGDMLYSPTGSFSPTRIQGCFLSDEEVNRIADHVRQANPSAYDPDVLDKLEQLSRGQEESATMDMIGGAPETSSGDADLFEQAVEYAIADGQISTSTLQRRLKVGYARAGRLTDEMEERGIVAAKDGSKPRKCLITREQWEEMKATAEAS